jgi:hypothetical protein
MSLLSTHSSSDLGAKVLIEWSQSVDQVSIAHYYLLLTVQNGAIHYYSRKAIGSFYVFQAMMGGMGSTGGPERSAKKGTGFKMALHSPNSSTPPPLSAFFSPNPVSSRIGMCTHNF